jgi:hypothetical protein
MTSTLLGDSAHEEDQIGCMVGALLNLYVGDKLGRKKTIAW